MVLGLLPLGPNRVIFNQMKLSPRDQSREPFASDRRLSERIVIPSPQTRRSVPFLAAHLFLGKLQDHWLNKYSSCAFVGFRVRIKFLSDLHQLIGNPIRRDHKALKTLPHRFPRGSLNSRRSRGLIAPPTLRLGLDRSFLKAHASGVVEYQLQDPVRPMDGKPKTQPGPRSASPSTWAFAMPSVSSKSMT